MIPALDQRIARAGELARDYPNAGELLLFYRELALFQKPIFKAVQVGGVTDISFLLPYFPDLLNLVRRVGPQPLADFGDRYLGAVDLQEQVLTACWERIPVQETGSFFARVLLQPFAEYLATRGNIQTDVAQAVCPFCNARPVVAVLRGEGDGGKRWLLCSLCGTEWQYRRVICPRCGEEDKEKLPIYIAAQFEHVRLDACDNCHSYVKSVDLTKNGRAVPVVDEIATVALSIWAEERGYTKLEPNLLGL